MEILKFWGEYRWLSNFAPCEITIGDNTYRTVEHAYMSCKSDEDKWKNICLTTEKPGDVKRKSRSITLVNDWESKKLAVMEMCLRQKFNQEPYKTKLIETGNSYICEGNTWKDTYWGVCLTTGLGENNLGKLIMKIRGELNGNR